MGSIAIEVIRFSPAAGFISMFAMSAFLAGAMTMLEMIKKSMYGQGVIAGEARSEARGEPFDEPPPWGRNGNEPWRHNGYEKTDK